MVDLQTVCCMCGDVGFPDKLFRCNKCRHRFQHSYCSNYYGEVAEIELCDWCRNDERNSRQSSISSNYNNLKRSSSAAAGNDAGSSSNRSEYSGEKIIKHHHDVDGGGGGSDNKVKSPTGAPSPRPTTRRYKLLKDVMC